jgi:hypothetical protein
MKKLYDNRNLSILGIIAGLILVAAGIIVSVNTGSGKYAGILLGFGAGFMSASIATLMIRNIERRNTEISRRKNNEVNDERNNSIKEKAGAKTNKAIMGLILLATMVFSLLEAELYVTLVMVGIILINAVVYVTNINALNKRM